MPLPVHPTGESCLKNVSKRAILAAASAALALATLSSGAFAEPFVGVFAGQARGSTHDSAWALRAGYLLPIVGAEVRYFDLGRDVTGAGAGAVVAFPVLPFLALTGAAGVSRVRATETATEPYYGVGLRFNFAPGLDASVEAQRYRADLGHSANIDVFG